MMADLFNKENLSPDRHTLPPAKFQPISPVKANRRGRSKSIGADGIATSPQKTSPHKDRRKSMFAPTPKSILPSKEDEAKRREARRKSLANRRVSFAPEATLHTWDVIEYMKEATTSSTNSEESRRASAASIGGEDDPSAVPATPDSDSTSPARQKRMRRRSSAVPPLNFNDPDEYLSSSSISGSSPVSGSDEEIEDDDDDDIEGSDVDEDTAMSMESAGNTADLTIQSNTSAGTTDSSARLDAALRLAAEQAGTRGIHFDEFGDQSEQNLEEVEQAQSWAQQEGMLTPMAKNLMALQDQENVNPFSPAFRAHASGRPSTIAEEDDEEEQDMSMDMTRAVGGIVENKTSDPSIDDATMDFTNVGGKIYQTSPIKSALKRRRSTTNEGSPMTFEQQTGTLSTSLDRASKRRRSSGLRSSSGDGTMDFTAAFGAINEPPSQNATMEFTTAIGNILRKQSPLKVSRRQSVRQRRSSVRSARSSDETMDFTVAIGSVINPHVSPPKSPNQTEQEHADSDVSMDLTGNVDVQDEHPMQPATPQQLSSPFRVDPPTTPKDQGRFKEADDRSAAKLLTPVLLHETEASPDRAAASVGPSPVARKILTPKSRKTVSPSKSRANTSQPVTPRTPEQPHRDVAQQGVNLVQSANPGAPLLKSLQSANREANRTPTTPKDNLLSTAPTTLQSPFKKVDNSSVIDKAELTPTLDTPGKLRSNMLDSIRSMSTPRKDAHMSPVNRLKEMTPRRTPVTRAKTPRATNTTEVRFAATDSVTEQANDRTISKKLETESISAPTQSVQRVSVKLSDFLSLAGIKFMDLTATKRRYTAAPAKFSQAQLAQDDEEAGDAERLFEESVAVGACTIPELDLYQHSCRELKRYISEGKTFLKQLESEMSSNAPPFMAAYMTAEPAKRAAMDLHLTDMKTLARMQSKEIWYGWRAQLLGGLEDGLRSIEAGLDGDAAELASRNELLLETLPAALEWQEQLERELVELQEAAARHDADDQEALAAARSRLVQVDRSLAERQELLVDLQAELAEQERLAELYRDGKAEALAAIEEAGRVKEACRGISREEVAAHQASVLNLERTTGWRVVAADGGSLTLTYRSTLELFCHPAAFGATSASPSKQRSPRKAVNANQPISLTYVAAEDADSLTTEKRFFLQLLRAQLQMLDQNRTPLRALLAFVSSGWDTATSVAETIRRVALEERVSVSILSDEKLGVTVDMLLPAVQTKVQLSFEISAAAAADVREAGVDSEMRLAVSADVRGRVVYGEQYKEGKMGDFVSQRLGQGLAGGETAVRELRLRLEKTGRKG